MMSAPLTVGSVDSVAYDLLLQTEMLGKIKQKNTILLFVIVHTDVMIYMKKQ